MQNIINGSLTTNSYTKRRRLPEDRRLTAKLSVVEPNQTKNSGCPLINRKRSLEPRPHPSHTLNKRYWDDVRAGRISVLSQDNESEKKASKSRLTTTLQRISESKSHVQRTPHLGPRSYLAVRSSHTLPFNTSRQIGLGGNQAKVPVGFMDKERAKKVEDLVTSHCCQPYMHNEAAITEEEATSRFLKLVNTKERFPTTIRELHSYSIFHPTGNNAAVRLQSASDHQIDLIADSMLLQSHSKQPSPKSTLNTTTTSLLSTREMCLVPFPVPILLPLPLTPEFIQKHYSRSSASTIFKLK